MANDQCQVSADHSAREAGFTIIELVITMALIGMVLALTGAGIRILSTSFDRGTLAVTEQEMLTRAVEVMRNDIGRLQRSVRRDDRRQQYLFQGLQDALRFVALEPGYPTNPGPFAIALTVRTANGLTTLTRSRAPMGGTNVELDRLAYTDDVILIEGAYNIAFSYREPSKGRITWTSAWTDRNRIPELIQVEIKSAGSNRPVLPAIFIRPYIDAEHTCARVTPKTDSGQPNTNASAPAAQEPGSTGQPPPQNEQPVKASDALAPQPQRAVTANRAACSTPDGLLAAELPVESARKGNEDKSESKPPEEQ